MTKNRTMLTLICRRRIRWRKAIGLDSRAHKDRQNRNGIVKNSWWERMTGTCAKAFCKSSLTSTTRSTKSCSRGPDQLIRVRRSRTMGPATISSYWTSAAASKLSPSPTIMPPIAGKVTASAAITFQSSQRKAPRGTQATHHLAVAQYSSTTRRLSPRKRLVR